MAVALFHEDNQLLDSALQAHDGWTQQSYIYLRACNLENYFVKAKLLETNFFGHKVEGQCLLQELNQNSSTRNLEKRVTA